VLMHRWAGSIVGRNNNVPPTLLFLPETTTSAILPSTSLALRKDSGIEQPCSNTPTILDLSVNQLTHTPAPVSSNTQLRYTDSLHHHPHFTHIVSHLCSDTTRPMHWTSAISTRCTAHGYTSQALTMQPEALSCTPSLLHPSNPYSWIHGGYGNKDSDHNHVPS